MIVHIRPDISDIDYVKSNSGLGMIILRTFNSETGEKFMYTYSRNQVYTVGVF